MDLLLFLLVALFSGFFQARGAELRDDRKFCYNVTIPVTVTSDNFIYGLPKFSDNLDITALNIEVNTRGGLATLIPFAGTQNATASYKVAGTYCGPSHNAASTLLLATHGATLDRYYWDFPEQPSKYSFVEFAISKGYSVFFYDRVGAGQSTLLDGYVAQIPMHVAVLEQLIHHIRLGSLSSSVNTVTPKKVVLVGHSLGAIISNALLASNPTIADGAVLTGWSLNSGFVQSVPNILALIQPKIANTVNPTRWGSYNNGWITINEIYSYIQLFYKIGFFDSGVAQYALASSWPIAVMEFFTILPLNYVSQSTIPVLFFIGSNDMIMCQADCNGVFASSVAPLFPKSVGFEAYIQPNTGHILTTAYNATGGYGVITNYLKSNGF